jgi:hypothetical protein
MERAFIHGFADLVGIEVEQCDFGPSQLVLSDYPVPLLCFDSLSLGISRFVLADLRPSPSSTARGIAVVLGEIEDHKSLITASISSSFAPTKQYFSLPGASISNLALCHGECFGPALKALDRALARIMPSSTDSSPRLGWWDKVC